ncbi:hypothetical protein LWI28_000013 [Acer negundo]|uniref:Amino acid transporter transmembrane domain-containing protein n=1 Tax=Acer negundo TaxID=4023 RepID=A0AAD5J310_ACENE|nr:hypothetical protein LWI28_000013 [Acer negundo]
MVSIPSTWGHSFCISIWYHSFRNTCMASKIYDTLKSPPPENKTMKKASMAAIFITTFFYLCWGCFGYAAFGSLAPGNLLTGFVFYKPYWLIDFANACIVLHLVGAYQLGWTAGPFDIVFFAAITLTSSFLLCNCYKTSDPEHGPGRNWSYSEAVAMSLGEKEPKSLCNICI